MHGFPGWMKIALTLTVLVLLVGGVWFYQAQTRSLQKEAYTELMAIARLKVDQIAQWRAERLSDAAVITESPFFAMAVAGFLKDPRSRDTEKMLIRLRSMQQHYHYHDVLLADVSGRVRLTLSGHLAPIHEMAGQTLRAAFRDRRPAMSDLHVTPGHYDPHLDVVAPIFSGKFDSGQPIGAILLQCDVRQFLYPLIQSWPVPSPTAEALLVRRDGEAVLFLNRLRHRKGAALRLRIPLSQRGVPAVMAVLGQQGVVEGTDYRGIKVLSVLKPVPGTPWFMVAKVDTAEALSVLRRESILILVLLFGLAGAAATGVGVVWQRNGKVHYREMFEAESAQRKSEERYRVTLMSVGDGVIATDASGRVELLNPVAERLTGWSQNEAFGKPLGEVFHIINEVTRRPVEDPISLVLRNGLVVGLANHTVLMARDGKERPIADSGSPILDETGTIIGVALIFRDQTAEREAERALRESEDRFRLLAEHAPDAIAVFDVDENRFVQVNTNAERLFGCSREELVQNGPQHFYTPVQPDGRPIEESMKENIERVLGGEAITMERVIQNAAGQQRICEVRLVRLPSRDRQLIRNSLIDVTGRKQAEEKLRASREQMRALAARLQSAREEERIGIAREIHDVLAQELTRLKIDLVWLQHRLAKGGKAGGPEALLDRVSQMAQMADTAIYSVQKIATELRPAVLDSLGLCAAVEWQAQDFQTRTGIECQAKVPDEEPPVDRDSATAAFRILQESLVNVMRHAKATKVEILLRPEVDRLFLLVRDNGCGIDPETLASPLSIGLAGMRERALLLGGEFEIQSRPGSGTLIEVHLPFSKDEKIRKEPS